MPLSARKACLKALRDSEPPSSRFRKSHESKGLISKGRMALGGCTP